MPTDPPTSTVLRLQRRRAGLTLAPALLFALAAAGSARRVRRGWTGCGSG